VRIGLTRRWGQRGTGFTEYDVHLEAEDADPKASPGVAIEVRAEEEVAGEWPEELQQGLDEIMQTDPVSGKNFVSYVRLERSGEVLSASLVISQRGSYAIGRCVGAAAESRTVLAIPAALLLGCSARR
jgi:hypothetical protein